MGWGEMGWLWETDPDTFWGVCLTELIVMWEQDFLAHWTTEAPGTRRGTTTLVQLGTN